MSIKQIEFQGDQLEIESVDRHSVSVSVDADLHSLFANFDAREIVQYVDVGDLLDAIGEKKAREHFDIEDSE